MAALTVLLGAALLLLALGAAGRAAPRLVPAAMCATCLAGLVAAAVAPAVATLGGPVAFGIDGLSAVMLAALFLWGAATRRAAVPTGALALAMLAADGASLWLAMAAAVLATFLAGPSPRSPSPRTKVPALLALACLAGVLLVLGGFDLRFAAMRGAGLDGPRGALALVLAAGAAGLLTRALPAPLGALAAAYLVARLLLDLCGAVTPGWWGVVTLVLGAGLALAAARRAAAEPGLLQAGAQAGAASLGLAIMGFGAALLARGADLLPVASLAVTGALLQVLCWAAWGALLALASEACEAAVGGEALSRMGGLLRRMPAAGLAMLLALLSMAAVPATAGFAGAWTVLQALLQAGRAGGTAIVMLAAGAAAALGLVVALLAASAVRLGGVALLGAPRTAKAAQAAGPPRLLRLGLGALAAVLLVLGAVPGTGLLLVHPGARLLAGAAAEGGGWFAIAGGADAPGYAAPAVAAALVLALAATAWAARGATTRVPPWQGGFIEDGVGRGNTMPLAWSRPVMDAVPWGWVMLAALALALAAALGWAAR